MSRKNYFRGNIEELVMFALIMLFTSAGIFNLMQSKSFAKEIVINDPQLLEDYINMTEKNVNLRLSNRSSKRYRVLVNVTPTAAQKRPRIK